MFQSLQILGSILSVLALFGAAYTLLAGFKAGGFGRRAASPPLAGAPAVTLLKPLHGAEPGLQQALESLLAQDYPGPVQVVFGVQDPADPALAVVDALRRGHPDRDMAVVVEARPHGSNRKVSNLINMDGQARHEILVLSDSDISVPPDYLRGVVAALQQPNVGVVTCPYYGEGRAGFWSQLAAMGISYQFLPSVAVGVSLGLAHPCMGSTIALRRAVLERIGGFEAFADVLADDYEIGRSVREAGLRSVVAPVLVAHGCDERSFRELVAHELRWACTIRRVDPAGFFGSGITHCFVLALLGAVLQGGAAFGLAVLALSIACRLWLKLRVDEAARARSGVWWLLPMRDIVSFGIFVGSFFVRAVEWRGTRFRVDRHGQLSRI